MTKITYYVILRESMKNGDTYKVITAYGDLVAAVEQHRSYLEEGKDAVLTTENV